MDNETLPEDEMRKEKTVEDYFDERPPSAMMASKAKVRRTKSKRLSKADLPLIVMGALVLLMIVFLLVIALKRTGPPSGNDTTQLEARLDRIEKKLADLEDASRQFGLLSLQEKKIVQITDRVVRLEDRVNSQFSVLEEKLAGSEKTVQPVITGNAQAKAKPVSKKRAKVPPKKPQIHYHHVKKGETLFSIAQKNKLSVATLRRLNPELKGNNIFPGQKLKVSGK